MCEQLYIHILKNNYTHILKKNCIHILPKNTFFTHPPLSVISTLRPYIKVLRRDLEKNTFYYGGISKSRRHCLDSSSTYSIHLPEHILQIQKNTFSRRTHSSDILKNNCIHIPHIFFRRTHSSEEHILQTF